MEANRSRERWKNETRKGRWPIKSVLLDQLPSWATGHSPAGEADTKHAQQLCKPCKGAGVSTSTSFNHGLKAAPKGVIILLYFLPAKWVAEVSLRSQRRPSGCSWNLDRCALKGSGVFTIPKILVAQSCPILCSPMHCSPPGSSVHGISQARILEWVAIFFSRGSS